MKIYIGFITASTKMFFRRKSSIFWSLFFPVVTMLVFGNANIMGFSAPNIGILNYSQDASSKTIIDDLNNSKSVKIIELESKSKGDEFLERGTISSYIEINE